MIDPGSMAIGALASLIGWSIFIFVIFLPALKKLETRMNAKYQKEKQDVIKTFKDSVPDFEKDILPKIKTGFTTEIDDFKKQLPDIEKLKEEFKSEVQALKQEFDFDELAEKGMLKIMEKMTDDKDEDVNLMMNAVSARIIGYAKFIVKEDKEFNDWIRGVINAEAATYVKSLESRIESAAQKFGIDTGSGEGAGKIDENMVKLIKVGKFISEGKKLLEEGLPTF